MPPQSILDASPFGHQIVAVIGQQADLHRVLVQIRNREAVDPVLDDGASDGQRVDLIRLASLPLPAPRSAHPMRRHANDPLARGQQRLLEPARDMPAVLDRPHPLLVEASRPTQRGQMPRFLSLDLALAVDPARAIVHSRQHMCALVRVRADHDHLDRPFDWFDHR